MPPTPAVLVVEDESTVAYDLRQTLAELGYDAFATAASADEALVRAAERRPDVALVDLRRRGRADGIKTAQLLQERFGVPIVYLTEHTGDARLERVKETRPHVCLMKPVSPAKLRSSIETAVFENAAGGDSGRGATPPRGTAAPVRTGGAPGARAVRQQLERVLESPDFDGSPRSKAFLRYIFEEALAGRGEELTQAAIATRVFGRRDDFDATVDPIVRIQAGRLRRSLERFYLLAGKHDAVRIELPRGTYVPTFHTQPVDHPASAPVPAPEPAASRDAREDWPSVVVRPFEPAQPGLEPEALASRMTEELLLELGRHRDVRLLLEGELDQLDPARRDRVRFSLRGRLREADGDLGVTAQLVDHVSGEQVWGEEYHTLPSPGRWSGSLDDVARVIAARVGGEEGAIIQLLAREWRRRTPEPITPFGAILLSYEFFLARDPQTLERTLEALQQVVRANPECGLAWTRLARVCLANYAFEVTPISTPIEQAITCAHHGVRIDPESRRARCILAAALLVKGELPSARQELEEALRLSPNSLVWLEVIGYFLTLLGDETRGPALIRTARERNPHCLVNATMGLWFDHVRRGEIQQAYQVALEFRDPTFFWRGVMRVSCLGLLGRTADARPEVAELLRRKADFEARGRILIGHYIKLPEVMHRVLDGFAKAGLELT